MVLSETIEQVDEADEFETIDIEQYRVLDFDDQGYRQRVFQKVDGGEVLIDEIFPIFSNIHKVKNKSNLNHQCS